MLHDPSRNRIDPNYVQHTLALLRPVEKETSLYDEDYVCDGMRSVEHSSPLLLQWTYQAAIIYDRLIRVIGREELGPMENVKTKLRVMSRRWLAAGRFLVKLCYRCRLLTVFSRGVHADPRSERCDEHQ